MEGGAFVAEAVLAGAEFEEVAGGFGDDIVVEVEVDDAGLAVDVDLEVGLLRHFDGFCVCRERDWLCFFVCEKCKLQSE